MRQPERVWELFRISSDLRRTPAELMGVTNLWRAYCLNRAVLVFGNSLTNEMEAISKGSEKSTKMARERLMDRWLGRELKYRSVSMTQVSKRTEETGPAASDTENEVSFSFKGDGGSVG